MHPRRNSPVTIAIQFIGEHGNTAAASLENTDFTNLATRLDILTQVCMYACGLLKTVMRNLDI